MTADDPYDLDRFVRAQQPDYERAIAEIRRGEKGTHWMWYIFPQLAGLGRSTTAMHYSIGSLAEADAYLRHPTLGPRLIECAEAVLAVKGRTARRIFGAPDDMKLHSSMTLFARVSPGASVFQGVLDRYFDGQPDPGTIRLLARGG